jgi:hypothetical protein
MDGGAPHDASVAPSYCDALVSYWKGDGSGADARNRNPLSWKPALEGARYSPGVPGTASYGEGGTSLAPQEAFRLSSYLSIMGQNPTATFLEQQISSGLANLAALTVVGWGNSTNLGNPYGIILCLNPAGGASNAMCMERTPQGVTVYLKGDTLALTVDGAGSGDRWGGNAFHSFAVSINLANATKEVRVLWDGNAAKVAATSKTAPIVQGTTPLIQIGGAAPGVQSSANSLDGLLDNLAIFSRPLTEGLDGEIEDIRKNGIRCP